MEYPQTIKYPKNFERSQWGICCPNCEYPIGFDGPFSWEWVLEAIGYYENKTRIMPSDIDGAIERHCHYLLWETKDVGVPILQPQIWLTERLIQAKSICIMNVWNKINPQHFTTKWMYRNGQTKKSEGQGKLAAMEFVRNWFRFAEKDNR